jgi:hypothetical protein
MGMDFSYLLYFKREQLWDALRDTVALSRPADQSTKIIFPDHLLTMQMEPWGQTGGSVGCNDPIFNFILTMYFYPDQEIWDYLQRVSPEHRDSMTRESPLGYPVGCIYLTVYNDLNAIKKGGWNPDLVLLEFGTPGTTMSILFQESASIRSRFEYLLEANQGICGVLNMEDSGRVIWLNGRRVEEYIPDPYASPEEIVELLT